MMIHPAHLAMIALAGAAAFTDLRTGLIPNWLTLPVLAASPLAFLLVSPAHAGAALLGIVVCGAVPYAMFRMEALGGGDVKLFAALGGLGGMGLGLEAQLYSLVAAMVLVLAAMTWRGELRTVMANTGRLVVNCFLPRARRRPLATRQLHTSRLGGAILVGTLAAVLLDHHVGA